MVIDVEQTSMQRWIEARDTGFGSLNGEKARFALVTWPEWISTPVMRHRLVPGTRRTKSQIVGFGPYTVEYEILITHHNYFLLESKLQTIDTLILPVGASVLHDGEWENMGHRYVYIENVRLEDIVEARTYDRQRMKAMVNFQIATEV